MSTNQTVSLTEYQRLQKQCRRLVQTNELLHRSSSDALRMLKAGYTKQAICDLERGQRLQRGSVTVTISVLLAGAGALWLTASGALGVLGVLG